MIKFEKLDPIIHAPVRLAVVTVLSQVKEADFNFIKETTDATDGNLSTHLAKLEKAEFIHISKQFVGKKPRTTVSITNKGRRAYSEYIQSLESYLKTGE